MGSVKLETRNEGRGLREWDYVPLSEPRVVAKLIQTRWKVDESYYPKIEQCPSELCPSALSSNGVFPFSEPVLCTYIDQDRLIEQCSLTKAERKIVGWLMQGYDEKDIAEHYGTNAKHVKQLLASASRKISEENNKGWLKCWGNFNYEEELFS